MSLLAPSVTVWAHTAFPELGQTGRTINLTTTVALDPFGTSAMGVKSLQKAYTERGAIESAAGYSSRLMVMP
jgi:hypothetical protein